MNARRLIALLTAFGALAVSGVWGQTEDVREVEGTGRDALGPIGVFTSSPHGDANSGVARLPTEAVGDCAQCHDQHASREGIETPGPFPYLLFAPIDNLLCSENSACHAGSTPSGVWGGPLDYGVSAHATSSAVVWPGPDPRARSFGDAGYCGNCHDPHARGDANGLIPSHVAVREEGLCLTCHDVSGPALIDIAGEFAKPSRHPTTDRAMRHQPYEAAPSAFGQNNRHAECPDCHNPHDVRSPGFPATAPDPSPRTQRVSRVSVSNGTAGVPPTYIWRSAADGGTVLEYEVCFKCHSSYTTLPPGQPDLGLLLNANNASFHPVETAGQDPNIDIRSFVSPWGPTSQVYCGDCHGSDDDRSAGPHGSLHDALLRQAYAASTQSRSMDPDELCFSCHRYDVYAASNSPRRIKQFSRWNPPEEQNGHSKHVGNYDVPCYSCHDSHGSAGNTALLVTGRNPGLIAIQQNATGGTCTSTCHAPKSYTRNYPR